MPISSGFGNGITSFATRDFARYRFSNDNLGFRLQNFSNIPNTEYYPDPKPQYANNFPRQMKTLQALDNDRSKLYHMIFVTYM